MDDSQDAINKILQEKEAAIALKEKEAKGLEALFAYVKKVEAEHNLFIGITWSQFAQKNPIPIHFLFLASLRSLSFQICL